MPNEYSYKIGDAFQELIALKGELADKDGFELAAHFACNKIEVETFTHYKYFHLWAALLIMHGRKVKEVLDSFPVNLNKHNDRYYSRKRPIEKLLTEIINLQISVRNFEKDAYDFINSYSVSDVNQKNSEISTVLNLIEDVNRTYDRSFNFARLKIANISSGRTSIASICLSVIAIFVAILSIYITVATPK